MKYHLLTLVIFALLPVAPVSAQESANVIPFQGQLANQSGQPLSPTSPSTLVFRLYRQAVGGIATWEESQPNISVNAGRFSVLLGSRTELPAAPNFNTTLYLGITVDDGNPATADVEMRPRQAIVPVISASYAKLAQNSDKLNGFDWSALFGTNSPATGALLDSKIRDGSLTTAKIGDGSITDAKIGVLSHLTASDGEPANAVALDVSGNVGIGTTTPQAQLDVQGGLKVGSLRIEGSSINGGAANKVFTDANLNDTHLVFGARNRDDVVIRRETGNVGIGTTEPQAALDVNGRILRKGQPLSMAGIGGNGTIVTVPWGTIADWNIFVSIREMGIEESPIANELDNAMLKIQCYASPSGDSSWIITARFKWKWSAANIDWYNGDVNYILIAK